MYSGEKPMEVRDELCMRVLGWRQIIRDLPPEAVVEAAKLLGDTEVELLRLKREQ